MDLNDLVAAEGFKELLSNGVSANRHKEIIDVFHEKGIDIQFDAEYIKSSSDEVLSISSVELILDAINTEIVKKRFSPFKKVKLRSHDIETCVLLIEVETKGQFSAKQARRITENAILATASEKQISEDTEFVDLLLVSKSIVEDAANLGKFSAEINLDYILFDNEDSRERLAHKVASTLRREGYTASVFNAEALNTFIVNVNWARSGH
jgi:hypothetical protein